MPLNLRSVSVQKHVRSSNARKYYLYSAQKKPLCDIDLSTVRDLREFEIVWAEEIKVDGNFTLVGKNHKGRLTGSIGRITVRDGRIFIKDARCVLSALFRKNEVRMSKATEEDFEMVGGSDRCGQEDIGQEDGQHEDE